MADKKLEIKDYAGGWITEKEGTQVPGFLKLAIPVIGVSAASYLILFINGEVSHSERGQFVQQLDKVTGDANGLMYVVAALAFAFVISVVLFAVRDSKH
ncbi:MAG: hypothetical protein JSU00_07285 [Acidobacteria bacterium]|nr:hypothetical protein [Acidobacteriota bacterium]